MNPVRAVLDLLAPARCAACRAPGAAPWCGACADAAAGLRIFGGCERCGGESGDPQHGCWSDDSPVAASVAAYRYEGVVADTVVAVKVRGAQAALPGLGEHLARAWQRTNRAVDLVTWVPADPRRRRQRGFDHAQYLAAAVAAETTVPAIATLSPRPGRADQASLSTARRRHLGPGTYRPRLDLAGVGVLLVDDVLTTGATAEAAADALCKAGAARVDVAVLARAGRHELGRDDAT